MENQAREIDERRESERGIKREKKKRKIKKSVDNSFENSHWRRAARHVASLASPSVLSREAHSPIECSHSATSQRAVPRGQLRQSPSKSEVDGPRATISTLKNQKKKIRNNILRAQIASAVSEALLPTPSSASAGIASAVGLAVFEQTGFQTKRMKKEKREKKTTQRQGCEAETL